VTLLRQIEVATSQGKSISIAPFDRTHRWDIDASTADLQPVPTTARSEPVDAIISQSRWYKKSAMYYNFVSFIRRIE
jgi:hypothetical protein